MVAEKQQKTPAAMDYSRLAPPAGARVAVVGGCGGIGRALVAACLTNDLQVCVLDLETSYDQSPVPGEVPFYPLDATIETNVEDAFHKLGHKWPGLDVLVNLVGFTDEKRSIEDIVPPDWDELISGNLRSAYLVVRAAIPLMHRTGGGSIINTASGLAAWIRPGYGPYAAAKAGLIAMTKTIALENAPDIRANVVAPGAVDTAFLRGGTGRTDPDADMPPRLDLAAYAKKIPLARIAVPADVVGPILFLAGEASRYMTGQVLWVNGGGYMP
jgi:3-oxoacyl-[acyl-carrier protein] reductase